MSTSTATRRKPAFRVSLEEMDKKVVDSVVEAAADNNFLIWIDGGGIRYSDFQVKHPENPINTGHVILTPKHKGTGKVDAILKDDYTGRLLLSRGKDEDIKWDFMKDRDKRLAENDFDDDDSESGKNKKDRITNKPTKTSQAYFETFGTNKDNWRQKVLETLKSAREDQARNSRNYNRVINYENEEEDMILDEEFPDDRSIYDEYEPEDIIEALTSSESDSFISCRESDSEATDPETLRKSVGSRKPRVRKKKSTRFITSDKYNNLREIPIKPLENYHYPHVQFSERKPKPSILQKPLEPEPSKFQYKTPTTKENPVSVTITRKGRNSRLPVEQHKPQEQEIMDDRRQEPEQNFNQTNSHSPQKPLRVERRRRNPDHSESDPYRRSFSSDRYQERRSYDEAEENHNRHNRRAYPTDENSRYRSSYEADENNYHRGSYENDDSYQDRRSYDESDENRHYRRSYQPEDNSHYRRSYETDDKYRDRRSYEADDNHYNHYRRSYADDKDRTYRSSYQTERESNYPGSYETDRNYNYRDSDEAKRHHSFSRSYDGDRNNQDRRYFEPDRTREHRNFDGARRQDFHNSEKYNGRREDLQRSEGYNDQGLRSFNSDGDRTRDRHSFEADRESRSFHRSHRRKLPKRVQRRQSLPIIHPREMKRECWRNGKDVGNQKESPPSWELIEVPQPPDFPPPPVRNPFEDDDFKTCTVCLQRMHLENFSKSQLNKPKAKRKCLNCVSTIYPVQHQPHQAVDTKVEIKLEPGINFVPPQKKYSREELTALRVKLLKDVEDQIAQLPKEGALKQCAGCKDQFDNRYFTKSQLGKGATKRQCKVCQSFNLLAWS